MRELAIAVAAGTHDPEHIEEHISAPEPTNGDASKEWDTSKWWAEED